MGAIQRVNSFAAGLEPARRYRVEPYYFALELRRWPQLQTVVEAWCSRAASTETDEIHLMDWLGLLTALPVKLRPVVAKWLHDTGEVRKPVTPELVEVLALAAEFLPASILVRHLRGIVAALRSGRNGAYVKDWLRLWHATGAPSYFSAPVQGAALPLQRILMLATGDHNAIELAVNICAHEATGAVFLQRPEWDGFTLPERVTAMRFACNSDAELGMSMLTGMAAMPAERRAQFIQDDLWKDCWTLGQMGPGAVATVVRRWEPGHRWWPELIACAYEFAEPQRSCVLALAEPKSAQLAKGSRGLAADLRFAGMRLAIQGDAPRALAWLHDAPAFFMETCIWLAALGGVRSRRLLREAATLPLFKASSSFDDGNADSLVRFDNLLRSHTELAKRLGAPYATWEKHFSGAKVLSANNIISLARQLAGRVGPLQMWWLQGAIKQELSFHPEEHAALFSATVRQNRRPLIRFLRQLANQCDERLDHPANRQWLANQSANFALEAWLHPPAMNATEELKLSVEIDPLEILKIGSYVGSCLAAGSCNAHAAVAILLDANKRVIFARNQRGRFVARQVVAISEDPKLVCYSVYPKSSPTEVAEAFERYVTGWATQLGLPLAKGADHTATERVKALTVASWYDDGLWDRFCGA